MPRPKLAQVQTLELRYINETKLMELLARLFPPKTYQARVSGDKAYFQARQADSGSLL